MPSLTSSAAWPVSPPLAVVLVAGCLYWLGGRRRVSSSVGMEQPARTLAFVLGLLAVVVALDSPLDPLADKLFAAHMAQHVLLLTVAPPLLVLAAPWTRMWRPLPLGLRRTVAKWLVRSRGAGPLRGAARGLSHPIAAWGLFNGNLIVWHIPVLYDLTLRNSAVHELEHSLFFCTGLLFWGAVIESPPFRARLEWLWRVVFVTTAMLVGWLLALVLAFATTPIYRAYAELPHRPGGLSALADQQIAAGVMWVPGSLAFTVAVVVFFYRWLGPEPAARRLGLAGGS